MTRSLSVIALACACATGCASVDTRQSRTLAAGDAAVVAEAPQPQQSEIMQTGYCAECGCNDGSCECSQGACADGACSDDACAYPGASYHGGRRHRLGLAARPGNGSHHHYDHVYDFNPGPPVGQTAYPYYTVRGPRDFLLNNPAPIGPF